MKKKQSFNVTQGEKKSELELFEQFYADMTTSEFTVDKKDVMADVIGKVLREEAVN
jgi:exonuclease SbcD